VIYEEKLIFNPGKGGMMSGYGWSFKIIAEYNVAIRSPSNNGRQSNDLKGFACILTPDNSNDYLHILTFTPLETSVNPIRNPLRRGGWRHSLIETYF
jgi:hypothetical protein